MKKKVLHSKYKKALSILFWTLFFVGTITLWLQARAYQNNKELDPPNLQFSIQDGIVLLTEEELMDKLRLNNFYWDGITRNELNVKELEHFIAELNEIEKVDVFLNLNNEWNIKALIRRPYVRILFKSGNSFYIDQHGIPMLVSKNARPRILTLTGVESLGFGEHQLTEIINNDSLITKSKLCDSYYISKYVCNSAFYDALIVQMHYSKEDGFILIPRIGGHKIIFGSAASMEEVETKFEKLTIFYQDVIPYEGWGKYKSINLKFENQIVAKKKS